MQPETKLVQLAEITSTCSEAAELAESGDAETGCDKLRALIDRLHEAKQYREVAQVYRSALCQEYAPDFRTFRVAYALAEIRDTDEAERIYEELAAYNRPDPAVLNNLGVIRRGRGKFRDAARLYRRAAKMDPKQKLYKSNLAAVERDIAEQVSTKALYMRAIESLRLENEYVVARLLQFYNNAMGDPEFADHRVPMPRWKFNKMAGLPDNRAEAVLDRWKERGYVRDTSLSGQYGARVYELNPFLHKELLRLRPVKVKPEWIAGFENVTSTKLAEFGYAEMKCRISKVRVNYRSIMDRDLDELALNRLMGQRKAVVALAGALVELALMYYCERKNITSLSFQVGQKSHRKKLYDCDLGDLLRYFQQTRTLSDLDVHIGNVARIHRNYIHPGKELRDREGLSETKASLCFSAAIEVLNRLIPK